MAKLISDFMDFREGDIITLSDLQTQEAYRSLNVDFKIKEVREYKEPLGFFVYTAYIASYKPKTEIDEKTIMLLIRKMGEEYDMRVFYLDQEGSAEGYEPLFEMKPYEPEGGREDSDPEMTEDLVERFEVTLHLEEGEFPITWDKQGTSFFGVETYSSKTKKDTKTIAEYFTNDDAKGNPHCFIEWTGNTQEGWIEVWYGCEIRPEDVEMFHYNKI